MKTILVADDSMFMRTVVKDVLGGKYRIVEADSGKACLEQFERVHPDLVLLDVVMPEGEEEGLRALRHILESDPKARVVMLTALGKQETIVKECLRLGAKGCIVKPFEGGQVLKVVEECLA